MSGRRVADTGNSGPILPCSTAGVSAVRPVPNDCTPVSAPDIVKFGQAHNSLDLEASRLKGDGMLVNLSPDDLYDAETERLERDLDRARRRYNRLFGPTL